MTIQPSVDLTSISQSAWRHYAARIAGNGGLPPWWTAVVITASSRRQATRYEWEIQRRREQGKLPPGVQYAVIPDPEDRRVGSGGATIHALKALGADRPNWWHDQRVLLIHSGGDSRRLPLYSISGKLFTALPVRTPWGGTSTVFDEWMALSTLWVDQLSSGLLVGSGDVILTFDARSLDWTRAGVSGVAMRQPAAVGSQHGVYVNDEHGRVYAFLQKPSLEDVRAAGGLMPGDTVALDSGLVRFCPDSAARLASIVGVEEPGSPAIDLYQHITMALTGQWRPRDDDHATLRALGEQLKGIPFWCSTVDGQFTHVGTTTLFRRLMTEETEFSRLYAVQQRLGATTPAGVKSAGVVIDSVLTAGGELGPGSLMMECFLEVPVRAARGSVLHGLEDIDSPLEVPEDVVLHQGTVVLPDHRSGTVIRAYGVGDDPKLPATADAATWFGRPILEDLRELGIGPEMVWGDLPRDQWTLWNAELFPVGATADAWECARWMMRLGGTYSVERWLESPRVSLAGSALWADPGAATVSHARRVQATWKSIALALAESGSDLRPMLAHAPGLAPLIDAGRGLEVSARKKQDAAPTQAASRHFQASLFFGHAGLLEESDASREAAFLMVERAVELGVVPHSRRVALDRWARRKVKVSAPPRIDLGGGWSDTPPFCLDWGGSVLNIAVELDGEYPIESSVEVIDEPVIRCWSDEDSVPQEYHSSAEMVKPAAPGDPFLIPRLALRMTGLFDSGEELAPMLTRLGGGLEIRTRVHLPMGSGLGTSSVLAASMMRAVTELTGDACDDQELIDRVMELEQLMTTGGGWQDQAGGIFPGAKLIASGPGLHQRLRVQPVQWSAEREAEFERLMVLYYTGIRRIARNLLQTVVGSYLARETSTVEVLHSIKTLSMEMAYAMQEGDWPYLGSLLDRHWELNQVLDPNTTNAPVNAMLERVRPYVWGAKLAGAGGGGFLMLLAKSEQDAAALREVLRGVNGGGKLCDWRIAKEGLRVE